MTEAHTLVRKAQRALFTERLRLGSEHPVLRYATSFHRTDRGEPLSFAGRLWLLALYEMWGKQPPRGAHVAFMKSTQTGISEHLVVLSWAWPAELGYRILYVLPRIEDRSKFYAMRFKKPMAHVPRYINLTKRSAQDSASEYLTTIGNGTRVLAGSNSTASFTSVPIDVVIIDEWDECDQANLAMAPERMTWSGSRRVEIDVGNPTVTGFGIHQLYDAGSQHTWRVACRTCRKSTALDFFAHVVEEQEDGSYVVRDQERWKAPKLGDVRALCHHCGGELDRLGPGRWVAKFPKRNLRSFHISKLFDGATPLREILGHERNGFFAVLEDANRLRRFYNSVLGLPYTPPGAKLTLPLIRSRRFGYLHDRLPERLWAKTRTMGIDVGSPHKVVVSDLPSPKQLKKKTGVFRRLLGAYEVRSLKLIDELVRRYKPACICIDSKPEVEAVIEARRRWGRILGSAHSVWRVDYRWDRIEDVTLKHGEGLALVDRTLILDRSVQDWRQGRRIVPKDVEAILHGVYVAELQVPTRVQEEGSRGEPVYRWSKGKDHFFHADGYDRLAAELCRLGTVSGGHEEWAQHL